jgi:serine/threonine protein kinase
MGQTHDMDGGDRREQPDEQFLDQVFAWMLTSIENGDDVDIPSLTALRPHLATRLDELFMLAREVACIEPDVTIDPTALPPGFTYIRELGRGAMGVVVLAAQAALANRHVALKILPGALAASRRGRARFEREATAVAKMAHPNIVSVHDILRHGESVAIVMEWIDGCSLEQVLRQLADGAEVGEAPGLSALCQILESAGVPGGESLPRESYARIVAHWGRDLASALHSAHGRHVLHRDVKPSNIMIRRDGAAMLTDFGLAKDPDAPAVTRVTEFVGTASYASPEQLRCGVREKIDARSDVYSLGATLFHALTLRRFITGYNAADTLNKIELAGLAQPSRLNASCDSDMDAVIAKAMHPVAGQRYQTALELADDLRRYLDHTPVRARPRAFAYSLARSTRKRAAWMIAAAAVLMAIALSVWAVRSDRAARGRAANLAQAEQESRYIRSLNAAAGAVAKHDLLSANQALEDAPHPLRAAEWHAWKDSLDRSTQTIQLALDPDVPIEMAPGGTYLAAMTDPRTLTLIEPTTGTHLASARMPVNITSLAISPGGENIALASGPGESLILLNVQLPLPGGTGSVTLGEPVSSALPEIGQALSVAFSPTGTSLGVAGSVRGAPGTETQSYVAGTIDNFVTLYVRNITQLPSSPVRLHFAQQEQRMIVECESGTGIVTLGKLEDWKAAPLLMLRTGPISFSPDFTRFALTNPQGIQLHAADIDDPVIDLTHLGTGCTSLIFTHGGASLWASSGSTLYAFESATGAPQATLLGHQSPIVRLFTTRATPKSNQDLWSLDSSGILKLWNITQVLSPILPERWSRTPTDGSAKLVKGPDGEMYFTFDMHSATGPRGTNVQVPVPPHLAKAANAARTIPFATVLTPPFTHAWVPHGTKPDEALGVSLRAAGDHIFISFTHDYVLGIHVAGSVRVMQYNSAGVWESQAKLTRPEPRYLDWFGEMIIPHANQLIIGNFHQDLEQADGNGDPWDRGAVYIFERFNGSWRCAQSILPRTQYAYSFLGFRMAISRWGLALPELVGQIPGTPDDVTKFVTHLYAPDLQGKFTFEGTIANPVPQPHATKLSSITATRDTLAIGYDSLRSWPRASPGQVFIYDQRDQSKITQVLTLPHHRPSTTFGSVIASAGRWLVVKSTGESTSRGETAGESLSLYEVKSPGKVTYVQSLHFPGRCAGRAFSIVNDWLLIDAEVDGGDPQVLLFEYDQDAWRIRESWKRPVSMVAGTFCGSADISYARGTPHVVISATANAQFNGKNTGFILEAPITPRPGEIFPPEPPYRMGSNPVP